MYRNRELVIQILPALRMIMSEQTLKIAILVPLDKLQVADPEELSVRLGREVISFGSGTPEEILKEILARKSEISEYIFIEDLGLIGIGVNTSKVDQKLFSVRKDSGERPLFESVPVPQIKKSIYNKIILITGAAQGFGEGIARDLFKQGANIAIADINEDKGLEFVRELNNQKTPNRAMYIRIDVTDPGSVDSAVDQVVYELGGLDVMISNAGILKAGSLEEMDPVDFNSVTLVNYHGFYHCTKAAARIMKVQNKYAGGAFSDIIQINSKSGLTGSKKNFAYAGSKFGGIGLVQSFALELIEHKIKVNAICPGNFFEGPLWSDPENGLFVQYLEAGKVPGAKNIDDVKRHYESMVPAGRGCRVEDVVKAILYVIEQEYETGQALPVTGGQEMLR
jgi:sorbitol-6-phosphate 2-dehydrogenase